MTHVEPAEHDLPTVEGNAGLAPRGERPWWRDAVVYQVYPRSFSDSDGDGLGDIRGIRDRLGHLVDLGVDAVWLSPFYPSPLLDGGYDVADPRDVDPRLGTVDELRGLTEDCHRLGLKIFVDIVPNHFSWDHEWFQAAKATAPGSPDWSRFHAVRGKGADRTEPPNDWQSAFGGPAWSPIEGHPGWWYLHIFDASQPDVNWDNPEIHADYEKTLRFWFDMGVDGFRIDVAHGLVKEPGYPDAGTAPGFDEVLAGAPQEYSPMWDQPGVHDIWREWRRVADGYSPDRAYVGEAWVSTPERQADYTRPDELHTTFNFHFLKTWWAAERIREVVGLSLLASAAVGAPCTWVLSNHDVWRPVTRFAPHLRDGTLDLAEGRRRALALSLVSLGLPGSAYLYQGEELGLPEVLDIADGDRQDPTFFRTQGENKGRDGCRIPIPWSGSSAPYGFTTGTPHLPMPEGWEPLTVEAQKADPASTFHVYKRALAVRRAREAMGDGLMRWLDLGDDDVVAFERPGDEPVTVVLNVADADRIVAVDGEILVECGGVARQADGVLVLPPSSAAWIG